MSATSEIIPAPDLADRLEKCYSGGVVHGRPRAQSDPGGS